MGTFYLTESQSPSTPQSRLRTPTWGRRPLYSPSTSPVTRLGSDPSLLTGPWFAEGPGSVSSLNQGTVPTPSPVTTQRCRDAGPGTRVLHPSPDTHSRSQFTVVLLPLVRLPSKGCGRTAPRRLCQFGHPPYDPGRTSTTLYPTFLLTLCLPQECQSNRTVSSFIRRPSTIFISNESPTRPELWCRGR